jgi:hypothetical protein
MWILGFRLPVGLFNQLEKKMLTLIIVVVIIIASAWVIRNKM